MARDKSASAAPERPAIRPVGFRWHSGLLNIAARLSGTAIAFFLTAMLARSMTAEGFARVSVVLAWLAVATAVGCVGMPFVVVRFVGENLALHRPDAARGVLLFAAGASTAMAALITALAWTACHWGLFPLSAPALQVTDVGLALIVPNVLLAVVAAGLQALDRAVSAEILGSFLRSVLLMAGIAALWPGPSGPAIAAETVLWLYLWIALALLVCAFALLLLVQRKQLSGNAIRCEPRTWLHASAGMFAVLVAFAANERIDLIVLGFGAGETQVALYAVAQRFGQTLLMAFNALSAVLAPQFVACLPQLRAGNAAAGQAVVRKAARLTLWICVVAWLGFAILGQWFMTLFGHAYAASWLPLMILVTGQVLACLFGPALILATLSGHVRVALVCLGWGMLTNALLNWVSAPYWGAIGAAVATAAGAIVSAVTAQAMMRRRLGIVISPLGNGSPHIAKASA